MSEFKRLVGALAPLHQRFVGEYLRDLNATQAAIRAGYAQKTARQQASRLLKKAEIAAAVEAGQRRFSARAEGLSEAVQRELEAVAFSSITDYLDAEGRPLPRDSWPIGADTAIEKIRVRKQADASGSYTETTFALSGKLKSLSRILAQEAQIAATTSSQDLRRDRMPIRLLENYIVAQFVEYFMPKGWHVRDRDGNIVDLDALANEAKQFLGNGNG
jgi:phage terminase small subunit